MQDSTGRQRKKIQYGVRVYKIRGYGEVSLFGASPEIKNEEVIIIG